jgi:hypothetical protein
MYKPVIKRPFLRLRGYILGRPISSLLSIKGLSAAVAPVLPQSRSSLAAVGSLAIIWVRFGALSPR